MKAYLHTLGIVLRCVEIERLGERKQAQAFAF